MMNLYSYPITVEKEGANITHTARTSRASMAVKEP